MAYFKKDDVKYVVSMLGYEVLGNGKFHWNSSKTADMQINNNGTIHCWTDTPFKNNTNHGDLIDFIQIVRIELTFQEAKKEVERLLNIDIEFTKNIPKEFIETKKSSFISKAFFSKFLEERKTNFKRFQELLKETLPSLTPLKRKELVLKYEIGYIKTSDRLVMPIKDINGNILTLWKYNKNPTPFLNDKKEEITLPKVLFSKKKDRGIFNIFDLIKYRENPDETIYLVAGEKDTLNCVGNGLRALTLGSEGVFIPDEYISYFKDLKIVIAYDYDKGGAKGSLRIYEQLKDVAKNLSILNWEELAEQENFSLFKGFDFTDYLSKGF